MTRVDGWWMSFTGGGADGSSARIPDEPPDRIYVHPVLVKATGGTGLSIMGSTVEEATRLAAKYAIDADAIFAYERIAVQESTDGNGAHSKGAHYDFLPDEQVIL